MIVDTANSYKLGQLAFLWGRKPIPNESKTFIDYVENLSDRYYHEKAFIEGWWESFNQKYGI